LKRAVLISRSVIPFSSRINAVFTKGSMKRLDQLTFTRFLALLLVLFYHGGGGIYIKPINVFPISSLLQSAPTAVSYLYVLSGFVMSLVYYRPKERFEVREYWSARFVRIYPLYIISFLLVCLYYVEYMARIKAPKILVNIFVLQAWYPPYAQSFNYASWSMTVEFFFYFIFPFFTMWAYRQSLKRMIWLSMLLWIVSQTTHYFLWMGFYPEWQLFIVYSPIFHLSSFILGAVGGIWFLREGQTRVNRSHLNLVLLAGSILLVSGFMIAGDVFPQVPHDLQPMAGYFSPIFVVVILTLALDKTRLASILNHPWLVTLGETAYALYILHVPVLWFVDRFLNKYSSDPQRIMDVLYLPLMVCIGLIAHFYIDRPFRAWLKRIMKRVSMPLLVLDLGAVALSVYLSFLIRFGAGLELFEFKAAAYLMFWLAFILRTAFSVGFNSTNPAIISLQPRQFIRHVLLAVTAGSIAVTGLMYVGYGAGWIAGFPRSVFILDWLIMLVLSSLLRIGFKEIKFYPPKTVNA
jgi:peptidoglycan/LPS O-acetylase OafA/YrhL